MAQDTLQSAERRDILAMGTAAVLAIGTPVAVLSAMRRGERGPASDRQRAMLGQVAQILIPRTDTPGGSDVGAHEFAILALAHGLDGTRAPAAASAAITGANARFRRDDGSTDYLAWLEDRLDRNAHGDFTAAPLARQQAALDSVDREAFAKDAPDSPWKKLKGLLLTGYYTSEAGASKELRYELVPGSWNPDLPLAKGDRAWSSDWTAVDFG